MQGDTELRGQSLKRTFECTPLLVPDTSPSQKKSLQFETLKSPEQASHFQNCYKSPAEQCVKPSFYLELFLVNKYWVHRSNINIKLPPPDFLNKMSGIHLTYPADMHIWGIIFSSLLEKGELNVSGVFVWSFLVTHLVLQDAIHLFL